MVMFPTHCDATIELPDGVPSATFMAIFADRITPCS